MARKISGTISFRIDGVRHFVVGDWTYNLGKPKREALVGSDSFHGYKEMPQAAMISGVIRDTNQLSVTALADVKEATIQLELGNGKVIVLRDAFNENEGNVTTEEGNIEVKFTGASAEEI